jgi:hypothetical protein
LGPHVPVWALIPLVQPRANHTLVLRLEQDEEHPQHHLRDTHANLGGDRRICEGLLRSCPRPILDPRRRSTGAGVGRARRGRGYAPLTGWCTIPAERTRRAITKATTCTCPRPTAAQPQRLAHWPWHARRACHCSLRHQDSDEDPRLRCSPRVLAGEQHPTLPGQFADQRGSIATSATVDEIDTAESPELAGADLSGEELTVRVVPQQADEFRCSSCFLIHHRHRYAGQRHGHPICRDCTA